MAQVILRPLTVDDYDFGYMELLSELTEVGNIQQYEFQDQFSRMMATDAYRIIVLEDVFTGKVIGTATLLIEMKFIHGCGKVGHVEDVVVSNEHRGKQYGLKLVQHLIDLAGKEGCYKVMLDCAETNVKFYEKSGMSKKEVQMVKYFI